MKSFTGKETNSIHTVVSAFSSNGCFEGESSKTVLLAHSESKRRREKRDLKERKGGGGMLKEAHGRQGESAERVKGVLLREGKRMGERKGPKRA